MMDAQSSERLQGLQNEVLEAIARGQSLRAVADLLCTRVESDAPGVTCSILTVDTQGLLHPLAGPSLPDAYSQALDRLPIGPSSGSCGTAAWRGEAVEVTDIAQDPLWRDYRELILPLGLQACWSSPIKAGDGSVIGTFAFYYRTRRGPAEFERQLVEKCVHLCAIAIEHEQNQSRIHQLAFYDAVTGLPNRALFQERACAMLAEAPPEQTVNLLFVDLDDFKSINDSLGHRIGDLLLERVAQRLAACADGEAFVARLGGDEFAMIQTVSDGRIGAVALAERVIAAFIAPFVVDGQHVKTSASIGIAQSITGQGDLVELARRADMAMYAAKSEGRRTWRFFAPEIEAAVQSRRALKQDLAAAIASNAFTLAYQPIISLGSRRLIGAEALLRWQHPIHGPVPPSEFVPIAEEMGMIGTLGDWVLGEASRVASSWPREIRIAVNLSPLQLTHDCLVQDTITILEKNGLAPDRLDLEVTESALLADDAVTRIALYALRDFGMRISLDDFGTGYSSLRSLRSFPFDKIKIDQSFVADIGLNSDATAIIRAVIALARDLGIQTAAEGIETQGQLDWLCAAGCTEGQGYLLGRPMSADGIRALIDASVHAEHSVIAD
ncbi:MAG: EAL domain-containing protein [Dokdonella sp.]